MSVDVKDCVKGVKIKIMKLLLYRTASYDKNLNNLMRCKY